ncbi:LRR receptor-like serine threonine-protein kinase [Seminavis robusta]|uniref:LRR receptor-like serine threonine-protein kinase n=1 Tax=Seminavis robusta TaxID=568900 RepID=A0A9N8E697_9STRA|nr:LRR receptor-like serine threonine-protein kinase [Seminavis robusta]|eukprot:Sro717_g192110.1 LRR receptor-like serine threonine-protein kinase (921) ;mRNA; r:48375-51224
MSNATKDFQRRSSSNELDPFAGNATGASRDVSSVGKDSLGDSSRKSQDRSHGSTGTSMRRKWGARQELDEDEEEPRSHEMILKSIAESHRQGNGVSSQTQPPEKHKKILPFLQQKQDSNHSSTRADAQRKSVSLEKDLLADSSRMTQDESDGTQASYRRARLIQKPSPDCVQSQEFILESIADHYRNSSASTPTSQRREPTITTKATIANRRDASTGRGDDAAPPPLRLSRASPGAGTTTARPGAYATPPIVDTAEEQGTIAVSMPNDGSSERFLEEQLATTAASCAAGTDRSALQHTEQQQPDGNILLEATLVSNNGHNDDENVFEAQAMDDDAILKAFFATPKGKVMVLCCLLIVVGAVILLAVLLRNRDEGTANLRSAPTMAPSFPTTTTTTTTTHAPTMELSLSLLPNYTQETILNDKQSPQAKAWHWLLQDPHLHEIYPFERKLDRYALATFYYATLAADHDTETDHSLASWTTGWLDYNLHECNWGDSSTTTTKSTSKSAACETRRTTLSIPNEKLNGTLPPELSLLDSLQVINLASNELEGTIPTQLAMLTELNELILDQNAFTGTLFTELGMLSRLVNLTLNDVAALSGSIPSELGLATALGDFRAENTLLEGTLPSELSQLTNLELLVTRGTLIDGTIPSQYGLLSNLLWFGVGDSAMSGTLPTELGSLDKLYGLDVAENEMIRGPIPSELGRLNKLHTVLFYLSSLSGQIPSQFGMLSSLVELQMAGMSLTGTLPSELFRLARLEEVDFSYNSIRGTLPTHIGNCQLLEQLEMERNKLSGSIPTELGSLGGLKVLEIFSNSFTGQLPTEIGQTTKLQSLLLNDNTLNSTIPSELGRLHGLNVLQMANSGLYGSVPTDIFLPNSLISVSLNGNEFLTGTVPLSFCASHPRSQVEVDCANVNCTCCGCTDDS